MKSNRRPLIAEALEDNDGLTFLWAVEKHMIKAIAYLSDRITGPHKFQVQ